VHDDADTSNATATGKTGLRASFDGIGGDPEGKMKVEGMATGGRVARRDGSPHVLQGVEIVAAHRVQGQA
jgi:hypothetical protein